MREVSLQTNGGHTGGAVRLAQLRRALNARAMGFALIRTWVYLMFLNASAAFIAPREGGWMPTVFTISSVALVLTLVGCGAAAKIRPPLRMPDETLFIAPLCACVGTVCVALAGVEGLPEALLCVVGGVLTGVGSGLIELGYGELYREEESRTTNLEVPFSFFLAAVLFCATLPLPSLAACLLCALLPAASSVILIRRLVKLPSDRSNPQFAPQIDMGAFAWRIGACACLVGIGDGTVRAMCLAQSGMGAEQFYQLPLVAGSLITIAIVYAGIASTPAGQGEGLRRVYRIAVFVMAVFYLALPLTRSVSTLESTLALAGYGTFNVLIWLLLAETAHRWQLEVPIVFGIGWGLVTLGVLAGSFVGQAVVAAGASMSAVTLIATLCILASYLFVLKESDFAAMVIPAELVAFAAGANGDGVESVDPDEGSEADAPARRIRFMEACDVVAAEFGLTPKETEIMVLYAKGRSSTHIQQELYLSRGTVTTHLRHIYQKAGVHGKQELIDLIERHRGA